MASGSPRRKKLLEDLGFQLEIYVPNVEETIPAAYSPQEAVLTLSERKAEAAVRVLGQETWVLAADTVVAVDGRILGKPQDREEAVSMLKMLSGRTHDVYTGVCLCRQGKKECFCSHTAVTFYPLDDQMIEDYVATGEPMDKAGAYGIQGRGALLVKEICGDFYTVVGLPLAETVSRMRK